MVKRPMSDDHKAALANGRRQGHVVNAYLEALETNRPKRGRKRTPDSINSNLKQIDDELATTEGTARLDLIQRRRDLERELASMKESHNLSALEKDFVAVAKEYGERKGIEYATWREIGVSARVLKDSGIARSSS
jgi:hypothetical protein